MANLENLVEEIKKLTVMEVNDLVKKLESKYSCTIQLENIIDKELIAGIVIKIDDTVYDNSLKNRLSILTASLQS